jgi:ribose transport system ATP-binding protein
VKLGIAYLSEDRKHFGLVTGMSRRDNITMATWSASSGNFWMKRSALIRQGGEGVCQAAQGQDAVVDQETSPALRRQPAEGGHRQVAAARLRHPLLRRTDARHRRRRQGEIYKLLQTLAAQGKAIVVISSELPEVLRLSHRIIVMCEGRITGELDGKTATQEDIMTLATQARRARRPEGRNSP